MILKQQRGEIPFSMVPWSVLNDTNLSWKAKGLLAYLLGKPTGWKIQTADLVNKGSDGEDSVRSGLKEIRDKHYGRLICVRSKGAIKEWEFTVTDVPNLEPEPIDENADNPDVVPQDLRPQDLSLPDLSKNDCSNNDCIKNEGIYTEGRLETPELALNDFERNGGRHIGTSQNPPIPTPPLKFKPTPEYVMARWNTMAEHALVPKCTTLNGPRMTALKVRLKEEFFVEHLEKALHKIYNSNFCRGETGWTANFDWFIRPGTMAKIIEGQYDNREKKITP